MQHDTTPSCHRRRSHDLRLRDAVRRRRSDQDRRRSRTLGTGVGLGHAAAQLDPALRRSSQRQGRHQRPPDPNRSPRQQERSEPIETQRHQTDRRRRGRDSGGRQHAGLDADDSAGGSGQSADDRQRGRGRGDLADRRAHLRLQDRARRSAELREDLTVSARAQMDERRVPEREHRLRRFRPRRVPAGRDPARYQDRRRRALRSGRYRYDAAADQDSR